MQKEYDYYFDRISNKSDDERVAIVNSARGIKTHYYEDSKGKTVKGYAKGDTYYIRDLM